MLLFRDDVLISFPEIAITMSRAITLRHLLPEFATSHFAAVADDERDDLACATAQRDPNPALATLLENE
jgi:hypothetical protein